MKTDLFRSCGHCWVHQTCWHMECSTFTASSFRIWNNSTGIPSPPLALFVVMLPKAHLTSPSRMSGCRWMITPSWLSGSWISFLCSSSVYSCHLFLISSASVRSIPFKATILGTFAERNPVRLLAKTQPGQNKGLDSDGGKWIATWLNLHVQLFLRTELMFMWDYSSVCLFLITIFTFFKNAPLLVEVDRWFFQ